MMQDKRNISRLMLVLLIVVVCIGCSNDDEPIVKPRPSLSATSLNLEVGDSAIIYVDNADSVVSAITDAPQVISLSIDGDNIVVQALAQGEAVITVNTYGARLRCDVVVNSPKAPQYDFSKELQDYRSRFVSTSMSLYYDTPGTIFSVSSINIIEVRSLITGDNILFNPGEVALKEGTLPNATLQINGNSVELKQATLEHITTDDSMWLNLLDDNNNRIIIVVTDI